LVTILFFFHLKEFFLLRDDDDAENSTSTTTTKKRKSEVIEPTKTLFSYFAPKTVTKNEVVNRRISGSHFFRAARLKSAAFPM
jgi:hypothetical protein